MIHPLNRRSRDQRKHVRVDHSGTVQFISEGRLFFGQAVNISRSGMQVVVNLPDSYKSIRSITFSLPNSGHTIELPCRIVRSELGNGNDEGDLLGLEFSYQGEAQMLLIENYIREMKNNELRKASLSSEMRQIPRADCSIRDISTNKSGVRIFSIDNISTGGLLISYEGDLNPGEIFEVDFLLPGDRRRTRISVCTTYTIRNDFRPPSSAGLRFIEPKEIVQARIRNFIFASSSSNAIKSLCERYGDPNTAETCSVDSSDRILQLFKDILNDQTILNILLEDRLSIYEAKLQYLNEVENEFVVFVYMSPDQVSPCTGLTAYFTCSREGGHYFKSVLIRNQKNKLTFKLPRIIFQSEKRSYRRKPLSANQGTDVFLYPNRDSYSQEKLTGRLIDISRSGFLCEVQLPLDLRGVFHIGQMLSYTLKDHWGLDSHGQIRHLQELSETEKDIVLQIGIEAGIERGAYEFNRIDKKEWDLIASDAKVPAPRSSFDCRVVDYADSHNQHIRALINATRFPIKAPVIVMPPGFGKKKEVLAPLVATLLANFSVNGEDIITIRYDGINRPGESFASVKHLKRGYEMLHYRIQQGMEDLETTLAFIHSNPYFIPEKVVIVSFSMSAIDVRRLLATSSKYKVDLWISALGVPAAGSTLQKILAGIDIVGNYKMGTRNGIMGVLGHVIDTETLARDLVVNKYAYMTDARRDMSEISIPVLWIYGIYDKWVNDQEVLDIMSINSNSSREVIEVPCAHNLHTSDDALKVYKILTSRIFEWLRGRTITPIDPNRDEMIRLITYERERLQNDSGIDVEDYWKGYLIGTHKSDSGYDFYSNFIEFRQFMNSQARLIDLRPGDRLIDLGCGTGLLLETILNDASKHFKITDHAEIVAVDLVSEALEKARMKCAALRCKYPNLGSIHVEYISENLEPSRWLPIYEYVSNPELDFDFLRNKVEGLKNADIDRLAAIDSKELQQFMKGEKASISSLGKLESVLGESSSQAVAEFNKAARFLRDKLAYKELRKSYSADTGRDLHKTSMGSITTASLELKRLNFGNPGIKLFYPFKSNSFSKVAASLFLSYLFNPHYAVAEIYRILRPGGTALISSMKPDSDVSMIFTDFTESLRNTGRYPEDDSGTDRIPEKLNGARDMLNEAAGLFELEQEGIFRFFTAEELVTLCENCGFETKQVHRSLGNPPQAIILVVEKPVYVGNK
jgi:ubiquinone/menaquinone biosynthesis C-methylase UbiE/c-di-GMP-binding flagellar brake protein YcgR